MDPLRDMGKMLLLVGGVLVLLGALLTLGGKLPLRLGRLPGDIVWQGKGGSFYFPIVTCIVISMVLSGFLWVIAQFRK